MDRCAMFVDAGYFHKMSDQGLGKEHHSRLEMDPDFVMTSLADLAQVLTGFPLLRIYWYDAAKGKVPTPALRELASRGAVKVRLGSLKSRQDGSTVQKGVDAEIHADMMDLARHAAVCDMILVSGDEDLLRAVEDVQRYGVRVHLWGVDAAGTTNQSAELIMASDARHKLPESWVRSAHGLTELTTPNDESVPAPAPTQPATSMKSPGPGVNAQMPKPVAAATTVPTAADPLDFAPLSELSTIPERASDDEEDAGIDFTPLRAGQRYGRRWRDRATASAVKRLRDVDSHIPRSIDGELLRYAEAKGIETRSPDPTARHEVRRGFWFAIQDPSY